MKIFFNTIGHSNKPIECFLEILKQHNIEFVVDVRSIPGSNKYPQYNKENLKQTLSNENIKYEHIKELGGYRNKTNIDSKINSYWINKSFHNYADYAISKEFNKGLNKLIKIGIKYKTVIMCAEVLWWRCHRRIITDYLIAHDYDVYHIFDLNNVKLTSINKNAIVNKKRVITYPS